MSSNRHLVAATAVVALLATLAVTATSASATSAVPSRAQIPSDPAAVARAHFIRADVDARYRRIPGRKLRVTEATTTAVVQSLTLVTDWREPPRIVAADNGIYFAVCSARAHCPYPSRSRALRATAFLPRRLALELALRTFLETSATLVVVALPTAEPVWLVFERADLVTSIDAEAVLEQLAGQPAMVDTSLRELVRQVTRPRLFLPLPILPPPDDTIYAARLFQP